MLFFLHLFAFGVFSLFLSLSHSISCLLTNTHTHTPNARKLAVYRDRETSTSVKSVYPSQWKLRLWAKQKSAVHCSDVGNRVYGIDRRCESNQNASSTQTHTHTQTNSLFSSSQVIFFSFKQHCDACKFVFVC